MSALVRIVAMGVTPEERDRRLGPLTTVVPYVLLAVLAAFVVASERGTRPLAADLALCALTALWILVMYTIRPAWRGRPAVMGVFLAGLLLITLVLVIRNPWFGFYTPVCYFYAFRIIGWPAELYFIAGAAVVAGTAQAGDFDILTPAGVVGYVAILLANAVPLCGLAWLLRIAERQELERQAALDQARAANGRLAAALSENATLQQQLLTQARTAGVLDERQRMAHEIHDTVAQGLIGIITQLQAATQAAADRPAWQHHHDAATALARESLTEARRSIQALRPEPLTHRTLADALAHTTTRWSHHHNIPATFTTTGPTRPLPPDVETTLLRTVQEALTNIQKHAHATQATITLSYLDTALALDINDNGTGFTPNNKQRKTDVDGGFGLIAMRERVETLNGTLHIESNPSNGTTISAHIPSWDQALR